ncbi:MAG: type II toxin-antitoxin system RelE/ParE family toxin [Myxococcales bacterium]|nr:type II toxin-antitoxin system RelE/ParE family toxin [Myxococcales bacterium]
MRIELAPAARHELVAAADAYEIQRGGRGRDFAAAVQETSTWIARFPLLGPPFPGVRSDLGYRRRVVTGFPFVLAYRIASKGIRIEAVAHMRRGPDYWKGRLR